MKNVLSENMMKYVIGPRNGGAAPENEKVQTAPLLHFPLNQSLCLHVQTHTLCEMPSTYTELSAGSFSAISPATVPIILCCSSSPSEKEQCSGEGQGCSAPHLGFPHRHQGARKGKVKEETQELYRFLP